MLGVGIDETAGGSADDIERVLRDVFGFDHLRPGQAEAIGAVLAGRPVVAVMPTGAGKSLCYQLPAVLLGERGALTLVVSPLIALMKDQVDQLRARGVATAALTSAASAAQQTEILAGIRAGAYHLVFVAPERFASRRFLAALAESKSRLGLFAVDEAHCISEWGHEFRPAYRLLGEAMRALEPPRVLALTATATAAVRKDIVVQLGLGQPEVLVSGFARPNLQLQVSPVSGVADKTAHMVEHVRRRAGGVALVYAATRKNAEAFAHALTSRGMRVKPYHAGLDDDDRSAVQDRFMAGQLDAIVATNAFGMGVDKADVRLVVHADIPRSPEAYYQEAGRAGRDGEAADCVLLFSYADVRVQEFLIEAGCPPAAVLRALWRLLRDRPRAIDPDALRERLPGRPHPSVIESAVRTLARHGFLTDDGGTQRAVRPEELGGEFPPFDPEALERRGEVERDKLRSMVEYAYHRGCRHRFLLSYFGDPSALRRSSCTACDVCRIEAGTFSPVTPAASPRRGSKLAPRRRKRPAARGD